MIAAGALLVMFDRLSQRRHEAAECSGYFAQEATESSTYLIGNDSEQRACLLIVVPEDRSRSRPLIRLEHLEVNFRVAARILGLKGTVRGNFCIVTCRSHDRGVQAYFFLVCGAVMEMLGPSPDEKQIADVIGKLAFMFSRLDAPPARPVDGLFGELFVINQSVRPIAALEFWRLKDSSRFDFVTGRLRLDVKTTTTRQRGHVFSFDQCNPPPGTHAVAASLFVERVGAGLSLLALVEEIEANCSERPELIIKLHDTVTATLGNGLSEAMKVCFDEQLALNSLRFFDLAKIPAIRVCPLGVGDIHFRSDLTGVAPLTEAEFTQMEPTGRVFISPNFVSHLAEPP